MRAFFIALCLLASAPAVAAETVTITVTTAQEAAEHTARRGIVGHCTRRPSGVVEGVGFSAISADDAIKRSCFWGKRKVREIGVSRGVRGWYAVVWYF